MTDWPERLARHEAEQYEEPEAAVQHLRRDGWLLLATAISGWLCIGLLLLGAAAVLWRVGLI